MFSEDNFSQYILTTKKIHANHVNHYNKDKNNIDIDNVSYDELFQYSENNKIGTSEKKTLYIVCVKTINDQMNGNQCRSE